MSYKSYKCDLIIACFSKFLHGWLYPYRGACGFSGIPSDLCSTSLQCIMLLLLSYLQRNWTIMPTVLTSLSFALWFLLTRKPVPRVVLDISLDRKALRVIRNPVYKVPRRISKKLNVSDYLLWLWVLLQMTSTQME